MGVLPCSRKDCENIMCDTYVNGIGVNDRGEVE